MKKLLPVAVVASAILILWVKRHYYQGHIFVIISLEKKERVEGNQVCFETEQVFATYSYAVIITDNFQFSQNYVTFQL